MLCLSLFTPTCGHWKIPCIASIHASIDDEGKVIEAEALQNSDPSLSEAALSLVRKSTYPPRTRARGPVQTEVFIKVEFGSAP